MEKQHLHAATRSRAIFQIDRTSPLHAHRHVFHLLRNHLRCQPQANGRSPLKNVVGTLHQLPSSYLRRTMLHSHIVHSASSGVTAHKGISHQGAAGTDWHLTCFEPVTTTKLHADVQYLSSQQSDSSHGAIIPKPSIESHEYHIRSIERFLCFTCEDPTPRGYRPATPRHQCDQPIRLHEWLRPFFQASLSKHLD